MYYMWRGSGCDMPVLRQGRMSGPYPRGLVHFRILRQGGLLEHARKRCKSEGCRMVRSLSSRTQDDQLTYKDILFNLNPQASSSIVLRFFLMMENCEGVCVGKLLLLHLSRPAPYSEPGFTSFEFFHSFFMITSNSGLRAST